VSVGVLVVGHGTADPVGAAEARQVAATIASLMPNVAVELGFLEVIAPTIDDAMARLASRGCEAVVVSPLLLFTAAHAKHDVPVAVTAAATALGLRVHRADALGEAPELVHLARRRFHEAMVRPAAVPLDETMLVMVGRGASDPTAVSQFESFVAAMLAGAERPRRVGIGFVAAALPTLDEAIEAAAASRQEGCRRVVVQPHLLFSGHVEDQVSDAVARGRELEPTIDWLQAARLGADPDVARAAIRRILAVLEPESLSRHG